MSFVSELSKALQQNTQGAVRRKLRQPFCLQHPSRQGSLRVDSLQIRARNGKSAASVHKAVIAAIADEKSLTSARSIEDCRLTYDEALLNYRYCSDRTKLAIIKHTTEPRMLVAACESLSRASKRSVALQRIIDLADKNYDVDRAALRRLYGKICAHWQPPLLKQREVFDAIGSESGRFEPIMPAHVSMTAKLKTMLHCI